MFMPKEKNEDKLTRPCISTLNFIIHSNSKVPHVKVLFSYLLNEKKNSQHEPF